MYVLNVKKNWFAIYIPIYCIRIYTLGKSWEQIQSHGQYTVQVIETIDPVAVRASSF